MRYTKNRVSWLVVILGIAASVLAACGGTAPLEDGDWTLESHNDDSNVREVLAGSKITARFDSSDRSVSGTAGCNRYLGDYEIKGNNLSLSDIAFTEMACMEPEGVMEQEQQYLRALSEAESYRISDGKLIITAGNDVLTFVAE